MILIQNYFYFLKNDVKSRKKVLIDTRGKDELLALFGMREKRGDELYRRDLE